jgi:surfactin synthase thioesterase subunit
MYGTSTALRTTCDDGWFVKIDAPVSLPVIVLIPHAGAGAGAYRRLGHALSGVAQPLIVRLPGRETRLSEPAFTDIRRLVRGLVRAILPRLGSRFVLYGHSMGALVAFEAARLLRLAYGIDAAHLVVSGMEAPRQRPSRRRHLLPDDQLWNVVRDIGGLPPEIADHAAMRELLLPTLRRDFQVVDDYIYRPMPLLPCPVSAYAGEADEEARSEQLLTWENETSGRFRHATLPGDHFFNLDDGSGFALALRGLMRDVARKG